MTERETITEVLLKLHKELTYSDRFDKAGTYDDCRKDVHKRLEELIHGRDDKDNSGYNNSRRH